MASSDVSGSGHRWRTNILLVCIFTLATYMFFFDNHATSTLDGGLDDLVDLAELEQEIDSGNPVRIVSYKSPLDENLFRPWTEEPRFGTGWFNPRKEPVESAASRAAKYHAIWAKADRMVTRKRLWQDTEEVDEVVKALTTARIVSVDVLDIGEYESGTAEKWIVTLEGGQKAAVKVIWIPFIEESFERRSPIVSLSMIHSMLGYRCDERCCREEKGQMKRGAMCNYGFEMPTSEIAAFHLHRILGFHNTPFVTGRRLNLLTEVLPVATTAVAKHITVKAGNETCLQGTCFYCKVKHTMCPRDGIIEVSMVYWIPRRLKLYTYPTKYMPFSTPRMDEWGKIGFNDRQYCEKVRNTIEPYDNDYYYYDLFDFAVIDTLMYHYDSKHYSINDNSKAHGLTVRLDHGRAFCAHDRDEEHVFLAPVKQCCTLRKSTYTNLKAMQNNRLLTKSLQDSLSKDPIAPILDNAWFPALERRLKIVLKVLDQCIAANGPEGVLVEDAS